MWEFAFTVNKQDFVFLNIVIDASFVGPLFKSCKGLLKFESVMRAFNSLLHQSIVSEQHDLAVYFFWQVIDKHQK